MPIGQRWETSHRLAYAKPTPRIAGSSANCHCYAGTILSESSCATVAAYCMRSGQQPVSQTMAELLCKLE